MPSSSIAKTELRLLIQPVDVAALRRLAVLKQYAAGRTSTQQLRGTCFDTSEHRLKRHGMALCVQRSGDVWTETLSADCSGAAGGLYERQQWEVHVSGPRTHVSALAVLMAPGSQWAQALSTPALEQDLAPMFDFVLRRTRWPLRPSPGVEIDLTLDEGELRKDDTTEPVSEVHLTLNAGETAALFDFALLLQEQVPLRLFCRSKVERGHALATPKCLLAVMAGPVVLDSDMSVEQAFQVVVRNCLLQMQHNEVGVMRGDCAESVHQMRVGMRRLRSALRLFGKWIPFPEKLQGELDWLAGELGAARDADVLADGTLVKVGTAGRGGADLRNLQSAASTVAAAKRQQAAVAVGSSRYSRVMLGLVAWLEGSRWQGLLDDRGRLVLTCPIKKRAAQILARRHKRLLEQGRRLADSTPEQRHRIRIAAKKARYAAEFFQSLHSARRVRRYVRSLTALQDRLGALNDAAVADRQLREMERAHPQLEKSASFAMEFLRSRAERDVRRVVKRWKRFRAIEAP